MKRMILCSTCEESFSSGLEYRFHFDKHIKDFFDNGEDVSKIKHKLNEETNTTIDHGNNG